MKSSKQMQPAMPNTAHLCAMPGLLLGWYDRNKRTMPWRDDPTPYHVLVSEIMLQQTQVETVRPYFGRFIEALPNFEALAFAFEEQLLKLWQGLGYYRRAHNLQRAAIEVVTAHGGAMPADYDAIRALPGVGDYTAGAIASIAFGIPAPAVDGNVLRVFARLTGWEADIMATSTKKACADVIRELIPVDRAGDFTQSLMELGALVCRPGEGAKCADCPLGELCTAHTHGNVGRLPVKAPAKKRKIQQRTILIVEVDGRILLNLRPEGGLLPKLYEPVNLEGHLDDRQVEALLGQWGCSPATIEYLGEADHHFSHITWQMRGYRVSAAGISLHEGILCAPDDLRNRYPVPAAFRAFMPHR